jgi:fructokinase
MMGTPQVTCIGEAIVDFVGATSGMALKDVPAFLKAAGGAAANVAVGLARLGTRSAFVGSVGKDPFGRFLAETLDRENVNVRGLRFDARRRTRLAFVSLTATGNRDFAFWESQPADEVFSLSASDVRWIARAKIVHISSFMLLKRPVRAAVMRAAVQLNRRGTLISFDPNLRLPLWSSRREAQSTLGRMLEMSDIVRMNDEEAEFLTGRRSADAAAAILLRRGPLLVVITAGEKGCAFYSRLGSGTVPGFSVQAVDTTGCGDAFLAALLHGLVRRQEPISDLAVEVLHSLCRYANAVGAITALHHGAMTVPSPAEVERFLHERA